MRLLVTDLDNTLYDWVAYFSRSFSAMLDALVERLGVDADKLCDEFKAVHRQHHNSEHPYAMLELPSVAAAFPGATPAELLVELAAPLDAFEAARRESLHLYDGVAEALAALVDQGVVVVGYTEAIGVTAAQRLRMLGVERWFAGVYCRETVLGPHPSPTRAIELAQRSEVRERAGRGWVADDQEVRRPPGVPLREVPREDRKPNPMVLRDICASECAHPHEAVYLGDSLVRDVWMARQAGVCSVWARYGMDVPPGAWEMVVRVTHWTEEDVRREAALRAAAGRVRPDRTIDAFGEIVPIVMGVGQQPRRTRRKKVAG